MKIQILILGMALLSGCVYLNHMEEIQNALISRPPLIGLKEKDLTEMFGLPGNKITSPFSDEKDGKDETWIYRDKWYGIINVRLINGEVTDVMYMYGPLSR
ncbi:MAG: hypothetical protein COW13_05075 [Candidatus Omnitrophica bacterium CG12_big_fil_rev_8_21_14_0_65_50_5]|nr:MAG: hypothetical protein COW13_05075 [Candidatus Omnitrophica bacterium CG12_big_fil_rev_8_21_14_0_65_50_5]